jgi:hypothetical protein
VRAVHAGEEGEGAVARASAAAGATAAAREAQKAEVTAGTVATVGPAEEPATREGVSALASACWTPIVPGGRAWLCCG